MSQLKVVKLSTAYLPGFFGILLIAFNNLFFLKQTDNVNQTLLNASSRTSMPLIQFFSFSMSEVMADLMWLTFLQNIEVDYKLKNTENLKDQSLRSWPVKSAKTIMLLSPNFKIVYRIAPILISVAFDYQKGLEELFHMTVTRYPDDWVILYKASYFYYFELDDFKKSAELLKLAAAKGGPAWLYDRALGLLVSNGEKKLAKTMFKEIEEIGLPPEFRKKFQDMVKE